jgi:hypothetical protein
MSEEAVVAGSVEFAERLLGVLNDGALALMLSIGHRTGRRRAPRSPTPRRGTSATYASGWPR